MRDVACRRGFGHLNPANLAMTDYYNITQEIIMQTRHLVSTLIAAGLLCASTLASAYDADWKRGRIYYRSVCTSCHAAQTSGTIAPSAMTKAEWTAYMQADKHAKGKDSLKHYFSKSYRQHSRAEQGSRQVCRPARRRTRRRSQGFRDQRRQGRRCSCQL